MSNQTQDRAVPFTQNEALAIDFQTELHSFGHFGSLLHKTSALYHVNVQKRLPKNVVTMLRHREFYSDS